MMKHSVAFVALHHDWVDYATWDLLMVPVTAPVTVLVPVLDFEFG